MPRKRKNHPPIRLDDKKRKKLTWNMLDIPEGTSRETLLMNESPPSPKDIECESNKTVSKSYVLNLSKNMIRCTHSFVMKTDEGVGQTLTCLVENLSVRILEYSEEIFSKFLENLLEGSIVLAYKKGLYTRNKEFECFLAVDDNYLAIEFEEVEIIHALMSKKFTIQLKQKNKNGLLLFDLYLKLNSLPVPLWPSEPWKITNFSTCLGNLMEKYYKVSSYCKQ